MEIKIKAGLTNVSLFQLRNGRDQKRKFFVVLEKQQKKQTNARRLMQIHHDLLEKSIT